MALHGLASYRASCCPTEPHDDELWRCAIKVPKSSEPRDDEVGSACDAGNSGSRGAVLPWVPDGHQFVRLCEARCIWAFAFFE